MQQITSGEFENFRLEVKHFFSGAAVYADGRICITLTPVGFAIKLPETSRDMLVQEHGADRLRYFPDGPIKKDYVVLPDSMLEDMEALRHWVAIGIEYALTLPEPSTKRRK
jgi:TfoX/Sxy family transcriptional regulator of competence genes